MGSPFIGNKWHLPPASMLRKARDAGFFVKTVRGPISMARDLTALSESKADHCPPNKPPASECFLCSGRAKGWAGLMLRLNHVLSIEL